MALQFENLVGKREAKTNLEEVIIAEVTAGSYRITPLAAAKLGITDADNVTVQKAGDQYYIGKGLPGVAKVDENGDYVLDNRGHRVFEEGSEGFGASTREISAGSNVFRFSNAASWQGLGSSDAKKIYTLGEPIEANLPTGKGTFTALLYPLVWERDEAKAQRTVTPKEEEADAAPVVNNEAVMSSDFEDDDL